MENDSEIQELRTEIQNIKMDLRRAAVSGLKSSYFSDPNKQYDIKGDLTLDKLAPGGNVVADSTGKLHAVEDVVVLTASGILTVDVPSGYTKAEIECIGGGGGGGGGGGYAYDSTGINGTGAGSAGGGGSAGQRSRTITSVSGGDQLQCYVGRGGIGGGKGGQLYGNSYGISVCGGGGGGGGNGGNTCVLKNTEILCLALGGTGGGGGGGASDGVNVGGGGGSGGGLAAAQGVNGVSNDHTAEGGAGGGNGQGYPFTYTHPTSLGGAGGLTTTGAEMGLGGNGGSVEYIESGAGGGGGSNGIDGTAPTTYQQSNGSFSGPHVGNVYSGDTGDFNGAGGRVTFMGRETDYGSGGKGGYVLNTGLDTTPGSNGIQGVIRIRFMK